MGVICSLMSARDEQRKRWGDTIESNPEDSDDGSVFKSDIEDDYHCPNCAYLTNPGNPGTGFWACQNRCIRTL